jgi:hypothetical protein
VTKSVVSVEQDKETHNCYTWRCLGQANGTVGHNCAWCFVDDCIESGHSAYYALMTLQFRHLNLDDYLNLKYNLQYAPGELQVKSEMKGCLYPCGVEPSELGSL